MPTLEEQRHSYAFVTLTRYAQVVIVASVGGKELLRSDAHA
jgi:hypothetical protein